MATTNNLDQENNLCITEDAFEQFQINSMYEEDEFITLSDIAPSEDAAPIVPAEMSEIPYDNEVVLGCYAEDDSKLSNKSESKAEITEPEPSHVSDNLFPEIQCPEIGISNAEPIIKEESEEGRPRRNRIKRHAYQDCYVSSNDKNSNNESSEAESSTLPTLPSKGRRGRKPKNSNNVLSLNGSQNNETLNDVETEQQYGKKRRGRPKKNMSLEPPPPDDNVETDTILNEVAASGDTSIDNKTSSRKRGKKKHDPNNVSVANDLSKSNLEIADVSTDCDTNSKEIKTKSKRGKKLKQTATTNDVMSNEVPEITEGIGEEPESPEEDGDDICLSKLKETLDVVPPDSSERNEIIDPISTNDSNVKTEVTEGDLQVSLNENENDCDIADPQIENNVKCEIEVNQSAVEESDLLVESTSKRPVRRKTKQSFYEEDSDEDPFANVELSDDDAPRGRKGRGYSDDEYIPEVGTKGGKNGNFSDELSDSDIDFDEDFEGISKPGRRKRGPNSGSFGKSPKKRRKNSDDKNTPEVKTITPQMDDDDIEVCLQSSVIKNKTNNSMSKEFEDFIAQKIQGTNIKIKKVTASTNSSQSIEIPVLDPNEAKKYVEMSSQTNIIKTNAVAIQTSTPYDVPMKTNLALTTEQREKACEFLTSVVKTTSELGQLMTQKSDDFIAKKINTTHVTDTFKMDYCVRKSFLLFKLAKHNLLQMEEDLAKQYTEFLKNNGLESCRETEKKIEPKKKAADSDSDCEIIEAPVQSAPQKPKFNPKTVFLNKELSIKIAKKPSAPVKKETPKGKPLNIKGRHTVWINDSIQVKKVAPNQSFLAQDSRNKKPPDCYVTEEMVSNFFENYYHRQAESLLAPYVSTEWCNYGRNYVCCYYFVKSNTGSSTSIDLNQGHVSSDIEDVKLQSRHAELKSPKTLFTLSTQVLQKHLQPLDLVVNQNNVSVNSPHTLFRLCVNKLIKNNPTKTFSNYESLNDAEVSTSEDYSNQNDEQEKDESGEENQECPSPVYNTINISMDEDNSDISPLLHFESPKLLKTLCYEKLVYQPKEDMFTESDQLEHEFCYNESEHKELTLSMSAFQSPKPLKTLCFEQIVDCFKCPAEKILAEKIPECTKFPFRNVHFDENFNLKDIDNFHKDNNVKTLLTLCVEVIQRFLLKIPRDCSDQFQYSKTHNTEKVFSPFCLRHIAFRQVQEYFYNSSDILQEESKITKIHKVKRLSDITFEVVSKLTTDESNDLNINTFEELTINAVNTLSEEAFHNINDNNLNDDNNEYLADEDLNFYNDDEYDQNYDECEDENNAEEDSSWVSKVQMQELRSVCAQAATSSKEILSNNEVSEDNIANRVAIEQNLSFAQIKVEPNENEREVDSFLDQSIVKTEPVFHEDEMTVIPESVVTKSENVEDHRHDYDGEAFETFVARNKIMHELAMRPEENDEIFSQSMVRIRRQYDPDSDNEDHESHSDMSLLVPQTFEPLHVEHAKDSLMESSSDEGSGKRATNKKKTEKRGKVKKVLPKKPDPKTNSKETSSNKEKAALAPLPPVSEVARLTRRMKDRLRQEEKKVASSESESEDMSINKRKEKDPKNNPKNSKLASDKSHDNEIQCNNVDSTANTDDREQCFTGFTAIDQNEMSSYQKYVNFVYDKILPNMDPESASTSMLRENEQNNESDSDRAASPLINPDEPIEMLECQPTMPDFELMQKPTRRRGRSKKETEKKINENAKQNIESSEKNDAITKEPPKPSESTDYVLRCGWKCYPINPKDTRLYQIPALVLEKLPESFVETYFEYQNLTSIRKEDQEVDRLINLHSLNRLSNTKDLKLKLKSKSKQSNGEQKVRDQNEVGGDDCAELTPSEDEADAADELPPLARPTNTTESCLAKNSLMDDSDSDSALSKVKKELDVDLETRKKKHKIGPKKSDEHIHPDGLMLTADKMMNKELNLLHAPVVLDEDVPESTDKAPSTKHKRKSSSRRDHTKEHVKAEDDSSSEEEKQWVSTKEKLLKRMEKKDITSVDDAKRAKLVSEFIERRGEKSRNQKRGRVRRRNLKLRMEREKQLKVLSQELYGEESTVDERRRGKLQSSSLFKGRRNIRKVIDKKSLARSTVIANMEEFERKRRLTQKQNKLCETLGCEEGVNVLVINDEVCLEYDFLQQQPVVTIHPFFTKVMKAHQYEGVKFMWDACFESLAQVGSGHPGGGCILAHCMGLGKTLQVLALLHTVLTHPGVGMQRVLVCCPLSTVLNWVDEIHKWIGPVTDKIKVFELSKLKKTYERAYQLEDWYNGGGIFIIGYELFRSLSTLDPVLDEIRPTIVNKIRTALLEPGPDIIVCDEGHLLKNDSSVLAIAMSRVQTKRRIVLTGTPMQNNLREYYCMVNFIKPNLLGTYSEYSNRFENPIMNGQHRDSQTEDIKLMKQRTHILHKVLEGCLQRQEASVLYPYLPKKHEYTLFISLTKCQWDLYKHYMACYANQNKQNILKDFHTLQKIWSHPQVLHNFQMRSRDEVGAKIKPEKLEDDLATEDLAASEDMKPNETEVWWLQHLDGGKQLDQLKSSNKFVILFRILDECIALGDKVLIFSTSLITMDSLEFFLKRINKWSLGQEYYRLDGTVPAEVRQKWCREFNAEHNHKTKLFLISTRAGSLGLNLVAANRVIILDTSWNPAHDIQSIFRVYRFGQKKDCYIYRFVALGTMEQKIYERSVTKQAVACRVVDEQQIDRHYNMGELTELYKYDEAGSGVAGGIAVGVSDVALLRVARTPALHAAHEHDSLLRGSGEAQLPEDERHALWAQFQEEQAHKQLANQLTSSFTVHQATNQKPNVKNLALNLPSTSANVPIKTEEPPAAPPPVEPKQKKKKKKGKNVTQVHIPVQSEEPQNNLPVDVDDSVVKKIMDLLIRHDFHNKQDPKDVVNLISNVRKIVAFGKIPKGAFNEELTQSIANVLLGKEQEPPPLTDVQPEPQRRGRGRPRKDAHLPTFRLPDDTESTLSASSGQEISDVEAILPSTSKQEPSIIKRQRKLKDTAIVETLTRDSDSDRPKRKAAIAASTKQTDIISDGVIDIDDDDWRDDDPEYTEPIPESPKKKEKNKPTTNASILLSDDDEPQNTVVVKTEKQKPKPSKKTEVAEKTKVSLHPSLLSNQNFIKIVAHTYLEGNPMLDEDAAILAAQYSTLKAFKEFEITGKEIDSGPIYDIAIKVLGPEILERLHKTNPPIKKVEPPKPVEKKPEMPRGKVKARVTSDLMPGAVTSLPEAVTSDLMPITPKPEILTMGRVTKTKFSVAPSGSATPSVVPVGLFKLNTAPDPQEESILPDDEDIRIVSDPTPVASPVILNNQIAEAENSHLTPRLTTQPKIIRISKPPNKKTVAAPQTKPNTIVVPVPAQNDTTICLDSDEEAPPAPTLTKSGPKRVALKSTAKKQAPARPEVVPVSLTAAAPPILPKLTRLPPEPQIVQHSVIDPTTGISTSKNFVMIPADQLLNTLNKGVAPHFMQNSTQISVTQNPSLGVGPQIVYANPMMNRNLQPTYVIPGTTNVMASVPQNVNMVQSMPYNMLPQGAPLGQNLHLLNAQPLMSPAVPAPHAPPAPPAAPPAPPAIAPATSKPLKKTLCKPGDILRITDTGQVEILNREEEEKKKAPPKPKKPPKKPTRKIMRSSSSSSSSSDDLVAEPVPTRAENNDHDPLAILRDVVHIKAVDDYEEPAPKKRVSRELIGTSVAKTIDTSISKTFGDTSITKTFGNKTTNKTFGNKPNSTTFGNTSITKAAPNKKPPTRSDQTRPANSLLKNLDSMLTPSKSKTSKSSTQKFHGSVDLTIVPSTSGTQKKSTTQNKVMSSITSINKKATPSKIVGTSDNIIISGKGKTMSLKQGNTPSINVTSMKTVQPAKSWNDPKKRPAAQADSGATKKRKTEPMTLKDFDIDDIDDIIELD